MEKYKKVLSAVFLLLVLCAILFALSSIKPKEASDLDEARSESFVYVSAENGESISVSFNSQDNTATILSGEYQNLFFKSVLSASGARYENADLGLILWVKGNEITLLKDDQVIFTGFEEVSLEKTSNVLLGDWVWTRTLMVDGEEIVPKKAAAFSLSFGTDGKFSGTTDCNSFGGTYVGAENGKVEFKDIAQTLMACTDSQEAIFIEMIEKGTDYLVLTENGEQKLVINYDQGSAVFNRRISSQ